MSRSAQKQIKLTKNIKAPNLYVQALYKDYDNWAFDEISAPKFKGQWRKCFLNTNESVNDNKQFNADKQALHLEIGPGNGKHFANLCLNQPKNYFLSIELKYKALIQTVRRVKKNNSGNGKVIRYNASLVDQLFEAQELNNIYIHFPDPWLKKRKQKKHQLIKESFCKTIYKLQKRNSILEFKTDSENYFRQSVQLFKKEGYKLQEQHFDLYKDQKQEKGFMESLSQFELLFFQKKIPIKKAVFIKA